jgi:hypothetical protein
MSIFGCKPPMGPDGRILYDPYERAASNSLDLWLISIGLLLLQIGLAWKLHRTWLLPLLGALLVAIHPGWTLRWMTEERSGDCGAGQVLLAGAVLVIHMLLAAAQLVYGFWRRGRQDPELADYGDPPG